jgi:hypothetical protein
MPESVTDRPTSAHEHVFLLAKSARYFYDADAIRETAICPDGPNGAFPSGRNRRNVWEIATQPYAEAHFATFPPKLVEPCVLAGSSPQACGECGAPWQRVVEAATVREHGGTREMSKTPLPVVRAGWRNGGPRRETTGWRATCNADCSTHAARGTRACVILDPFAGAGTTGVVALRHDRSFIGIELNPAYAEMARWRIRDDAPLLNTVVEAVG